MLQKFKQPGFFRAYLCAIAAWYLIGLFLLSTVIHIAFVLIYGAFLTELMPIEEWVSVLITAEIVTAMLASYQLVKRFVIPFLHATVLKR